jgi:hypothetical protein
MKVDLMGETYSVFNGELVLKNDSTSRKAYTHYILRCAIRVFLRLMNFFFACTITCLVYTWCIATPTIAETIALGAVFATLGSSIVSVFSILCKEQYNQFYENIKVFQTQLIGCDIWERWPFVKRISKRRGANGESEYQILSNPYLVFQCFGLETHIDLPSSKTDFHELPILYVYLTLKKRRLTYRKYLALSPDSTVVRDILLWDCITELYGNILKYRIGQYAIWLGSSFVLSSIIFAFFYKFLINLTTLL